MACCRSCFQPGSAECARHAVCLATEILFWRYLFTAGMFCQAGWAIRLRLVVTPECLSGIISGLATVLIFVISMTADDLCQWKLKFLLEGMTSDMSLPYTCSLIAILQRSSFTCHFVFCLLLLSRDPFRADFCWLQAATFAICVKLHLNLHWKPCDLSVPRAYLRLSAGMETPDHNTDHHAEALTHSAIVIQSNYRGHKCR